MKRLSTIFIGLFTILSANADDRLTLSAAGSSISIGLNNDVSFTAFQMDVIIPQGMTKTAVTPASRIASPLFVVDSEMIENNVLRVIAYNTSNRAISGNTGELVNIALSASLKTTDIVEVKNIRFVNADNLSEVVLADYSPYLIGDANGDKNVSISDYSAIVSHILDNTPNNFIEKAADVNCDGNISVSDLSALVQIILYQNDPVSRAKAFSYIVPKASLYSDDVSFDANGEALVRVNMDNNMAVDGFQFDIVLPENIQLKDIQQGTCHHNGNGNCTFRYAILKNGNIRVLCSSTSNSTIDGADGGIVEISLATDCGKTLGAQYVQIVNGEVSSRGTAVKTDDFTIRLTSDYTTGVNLVSKNKKMMIYDLNGRLLKRAATASDFKSLPKGIYIVDGNKIVK